MGWQYRRSFGLGRRGRVNLSKSGLSVSRRFGPLSVNSRGRASLRLSKGLRYTFRLFK